MKETIVFPNKLTGPTFYKEILPVIYQKLLKRSGKISFDLTNLTFADPEGLVNFLCISAITKIYSTETAELILPQNDEVLKYFENYGFFSIARTPGSEVLGFLKFEIYPEYKNKSITKIHGVYNHTSAYEISNNVNSVINLLQKYFVLNLSLINYLSFIINETIRNIIEHNFENKPISANGYYMAQKTPLNKFEFIISDFGKGYRKRIIEMLGEKEDKNYLYYKQYQNYILNESKLLEASQNNPNYVAIQAAINFRKGTQRKPGLYQIKEFVNSLNGTVSIHSENIKIVFYKNDKSDFFYYDSFYPGCHIKIEIPL